MITQALTAWVVGMGVLAGVFAVGATIGLLLAVILAALDEHCWDTMERLRAIVRRALFVVIAVLFAIGMPLAMGAKIVGPIQ